jgi:DNA polymerase-4
VILHLDLDAFFSAVEQLHKPSLRGRPVIVGGIGRRGVVATASYEARAYGIGSAMPIGQARRLCPNAAYLVPRFTAYQTISAQIMDLLRETSPLLEQVSVDEAYLDLAPVHPDADVTEVTALAEELRARVRTATGLTASVGAGSNKLVAKIGSELAKPDGLTIVAPGEEAATLAPLPIGRLPWAGPATREMLRKRRVTTVGQLAAMELADVVELLGQAHGTALHQYARGIDRRVVVTEREAKSVSAEETFAVDLTDRRELDGHLRRLVGRVSARLAEDGLFARTVTVKVRHFDFTTLTRSLTLDQPTDSPAAFLDAARHLLAVVDTRDGVRLLGFSVSGLRDYAQQDLLADLLTPVPVSAIEAPDADDEPNVEGSSIEEAGNGAGSGRGSASAQDGSTPARRGWVPGQDVRHREHGPGWVQGSGLGLVTVRFEGPHTPPGRIRTFEVSDPDLSSAPPPTW